MRTPRLLAAGCAALLVVLVAAGGAAAQGGVSDKLRSGGDVTVGSGETIDHDLYVFGGTVRVDGTINGDLVTSGGQVVVNGTVTGDVVAAGGTLDIRGQVDGDVRIAGGTVTIDGSVAEDVLAAGGQVRLAEGGTIGEDMVASAGQLTVAGDVQGSVLGTAGTYTRTGTIGGSEDVNITETDPVAPSTMERVLDGLRYVVIVVLFGLLALRLAPRLFRRAEATIARRPLPVVGWGLVALIGFIVAVVVIPIVAVLVAIILALLGFDGLVALAIVAGFVAVGGLVLAFGLLAGFLADAVVGFALARLVAGRSGTRATGVEPGRDVPLLVVGAIVVAIAASLPIIGGFVKAVVVVLGLGALIASWWYARRGTAEPLRVDEGGAR